MAEINSMRVAMYRRACARPARANGGMAATNRDLRLRGKAWTDAELAVLRDGLEKGEAPRAIAERIPSRGYASVLAMSHRVRQSLRCADSRGKNGT